MAPTTQEEGEEGSASRSRQWRRRTPATRLSAGQSEAAPSSRRSRAGAAEEESKRAASNTGGQQREEAAASSSAASKRAKKKRSRAGKERSRKRRRDRAPDVGRVGEENASSRAKRRNTGDPEAASASAATEQAASSSGASSAVSSPVRRPCFKRAVLGVDPWGSEILEPLSNIDPGVLNAFQEHNAKYFAKERNHLKLVTLEPVPRSCLENPKFGLIRESASDMVLRTGKVVFGLSSYIDGNLLTRASGFIIDWDKESKIGTVLTSALLIRTKSPSFDEWLATDEFAPHAEVHVHLLDKYDTDVPAELIYFHKHYNFALFKFKIDLIAEIPSFSTELKFGQEIFVIGRDENRNLIVDHGNVLHRGPSSFERHHNMFTSCKVNECCLGGQVIDLNGQVLGMVSLPEMTFIPSAIILKCLHIWKIFACIPRLHTGMKYSAIKFLDPVHREKISRKCEIDAGLIVTEVSEGSVAEKVGIRIGDIVECWDGELVSTTFELEDMLLRMCEAQLENGGGIGSIVEIPVGTFRVRKGSRCTMILKLKVSDDVEVVAKGEYDVSGARCSVVSDDTLDSGLEAPRGTDEDKVGGK